MSKCIAKSASHALEILICKDYGQSSGRNVFKCFTKCYNSLVQPVTGYGSCV